MGILGINIVPQPVVMNLETGSVWLPPVDVSSGRTCNRVFWSRDLGILINSGTYKETPAVFTHTFDGKKLANYRGKFTEVSPSKEKILIDNDVLIDLRTNSRTTLAWSLDDYEEQILSEVFWTSDETRLYRCCYFYADLTTGTSHRFKRSDFQDINGNYLDPSGLWFYRGQWVRNDTYFLVEWSWIDDGDIRYLPMLDPIKKISYDIREMAGISEDWSCYQTTVSPDGNYVWMVGGDGSYLVNLFTFESQFYPGSEYLNIEWSPNGKFAWFRNEPAQTYLLSVLDKKLGPLTIDLLPNSDPTWHPTEDVLAYITEDAQKFELLDPHTMTTQGTIILPTTFKNFVWSPTGEYIALAAEDGSLWQVDYPKMKNLERLTPPLLNVTDLTWSPDGNFISFVSDSDIYIVGTEK